ncbi:MAG: quinone-dependent dihydroorotate dehydrogenase [Gammaproteobacteria bacterium]|nr:quinone-dependent dihydroorotate dehydrogenase [Gammaproteobacteria bacterium]MCW8908982.1 quinone-dependent dihydroorotate dehydrogenase [Gammaproteobacteria bacterium]MCW9006008.1 quinone-dependent dihydroorotate dehydrogenase [Gammaproteobacteria bacterium]MCW9055648.1 quinone-dependent dihydroorotate dehydrogenase [Gammaproteobacteria bacterium]
MGTSPYKILRKILFMMDAERAHEFSLKSLKTIHQLKLGSILFGHKYKSEIQVMDIDFPNPVGLAAGLDKNGDYFDALSDCGFGFVEIGTVTPRPQSGNPQPRLFRLPEAEAIINRMGFNNKGVDYLIEQVKKSSYKGVLGINIGKNFDTPVEKAVDDYLICLEKVYLYADYVTVNISSPNTPGLRDLQFGEALDELLIALKHKQKELAQQSGKYVPLAVKIAPDMDDASIQQLAETFIKHEIDAVIATNTTSSRDGVEGLKHADEQGGLSGRPVKDKSDHVLHVLVTHLQGRIPVIAAGGISSAQDAVNKLRLGASLVQVYTGFIYQGSALVRDCVQACIRNSRSSG